MYIWRELYHRTPAPKEPACLSEVEKHITETPPAPVNPLKQNKLVRKPIKKSKKLKKVTTTKHKKVFRALSLSPAPIIIRKRHLFISTGSV